MAGAHGSEKPLGGRTALVTGASKGIGQGIAIELARCGANLAVGYVRDEVGAAATVATALSVGVQAAAFQCDVSDRDQVFAMVHSVEATLGGPDIVVSGAVDPIPKPLMELTAAEWHTSMDVTVSALLYLAQAAVPGMRRRGAGWLIPVTSQGAVRVIANYAPLGVPKAALDHLMRYLAAELGPQGIRVNAVSPGTVDTAALRTVKADGVEERLARVRAKAPARRTVSPAEVGRLVAFLCSEDADLMRGQVVNIDGGISIY